MGGYIEGGWGGNAISASRPSAGNGNKSPCVCVSPERRKRWRRPPLGSDPTAWQVGSTGQGRASRQAIGSDPRPQESRQTASPTDDCPALEMRALRAHHPPWYLTTVSVRSTESGPTRAARAGIVSHRIVNSPRRCKPSVSSTAQHRWGFHLSTRRSILIFGAA